jgi:hypothetical protein
VTYDERITLLSRKTVSALRLLWSNRTLRTMAIDRGIEFHLNESAP